MTNPVETAGEERLRRWRLVLGGGEADGTGAALGTADQGMDEALAAVYEGALMRSVPRPAAAGAGLGPSAPAVVRWLGDIRAYFPSTVVRVIQQDAVARLGLAELLLEPEGLQAGEPDVPLGATLLPLDEPLPILEVDPVRIGVAGWSLGARIAAVLAGAEPRAGLDQGRRRFGLLLAEPAEIEPGDLRLPPRFDK